MFGWMPWRGCDSAVVGAGRDAPGMAKSRGSGGGRSGAAGFVGPPQPFFLESDMLKLHPHKAACEC